MIQFLIDNGANVNSRNSKGKGSKSVLHFAVAGGDEEVFPFPLFFSFLLLDYSLSDRLYAC